MLVNRALKPSEIVEQDRGPSYFLDGCAYVEAASREVKMPSLFDAVKIEDLGNGNL